MSLSKSGESSPLRIGLVRRGYSPAGGAESYLRGFAQAAKAAGHAVVLFASLEWQEWVFVEKFTVPGKSPAAFSDALANARPREKCDVLFSLERVSSCDVYRAGDGVHAAWLERRRPFENSLRSWARELNPKHRALMALEKMALIGARKIIANSRMVREDIERFYGPEIAGKVHVVYNGIDPEKWRRPGIARGEFRRRLGISSEMKVAVFIGSGWMRKGLRYAIAATEKAGATLLVSGKGHLRYCPPHVRLLGPTSQVADVLHASDAFILPTIYDPFSNATLEALAAGLPVITTAANGVSEILDPKIDGSVVARADDIRAFTVALERWLPEGISQLRQEHASAWTTKRHFAETLRIIES